VPNTPLHTLHTFSTAKSHLSTLLPSNLATVIIPLRDPSPCTSFHPDPYPPPQSLTSPSNFGPLAPEPTLKHPSTPCFRYRMGSCKWSSIQVPAHMWGDSNGSQVGRCQASKATAHIWCDVRYQAGGKATAHMWRDRRSESWALGM
jgi:hypothetical protein